MLMYSFDAGIHNAFNSLILTSIYLYLYLYIGVHWLMNKKTYLALLPTPIDRLTG